MPANLTPEYRKAEERYRQAAAPEEKLACLEEMLRLVPKHKGTDKMQADLKRRISQLRRRDEKRHAKRVNAFSVSREGAGQVVLLGCPNVGKSRIVASLSNGRVEVAGYPFTTQVPTPGMMLYEDVKIQLVDMPPLTADFIHAWMPGLVAHADAALVVVDLATDEALDQADAVFEHLDKRRIRLVGEIPATDENDLDTYRKALLVGNKCDVPGAEDRARVLKELYADRMTLRLISAATGLHLDDLRAHIFQMLNVLRVYSKIPGKAPDMDEPFVLPVGSTIQDMAKAVHKEVAATIKSARVWGGAKYDGQQVGRGYVIQDRDVIELHH